MGRSATNRTRMATRTQSHGNWDLYAETDTDPGEVCKTNWFAVHQGTGAIREIDYSPYDSISAITFKQIVELDFPDRVDLGPLNSEQVELLWWEKFPLHQQARDVLSRPERHSLPEIHQAAMVMTSSISNATEHLILEALINASGRTKSNGLIEHRILLAFVSIIAIAAIYFAI